MRLAFMRRTVLQLSLRLLLLVISQSRLLLLCEAMLLLPLWMSFQRAQYPLIKECTLHHNFKALII